MASFSVKTFHKGHMIFREGQPGNTAFLIKKGAVETYSMKENEKIPLEQLRPGQIVGEMALIKEGPRSCSAVATDFSELVVVEKQLLDQFIKNSPGIVQAFINALITQFKYSENKEINEPKFLGDYFLGVSKAINFLFLLNQYMFFDANKSRGKDQEYSGIDHMELSKKIRVLYPVDQLDIDNILKKLTDLYYVDITFKKGQGNNTMQKFIKVKDPDNFERAVENIAPHLSSDPAFLKKEFIDLYEAAKMVDVAPEIIYKKIAAGEIPENIFFMNKAGFMDLAAEKGEYFFKKVKKKRVNIEDLEDVNDLIFVDTKTLRDVLSEIGFYKVGVLLHQAEEEAKNKIQSCLSERITKMVEEELGSMEDIDEIEAAEIEEEVIELIKKKKGATT